MFAWIKYGKGVYFAKDASFSARYMTGAQKLMFQATVLVGQCVTGDSSMREPPLLLGTTTNEHYDSTGDATGTDPSIAVVYNDTMCYPSYLITA